MFIRNWTDFYRFETIKFFYRTAAKDPKFWIFLAGVAATGFIGYIVCTKLMNDK